ncbi:hypothetical protein BLA29_001252 [Euroglyphus maynei]|uniref:Inositol-1-monophosphatase n=1 Tax=Euroglyphus maynei TaxID=6958 RepID=A0A1Y3AWP5_EURMA|nr:hypothetical protein BLA29_001252 [Euroglyphus maynei]
MTSTPDSFVFHISHNNKSNVPKMDKLDEYLDVAIDLAKQAGQMIIEWHRKGSFEVNIKSNIKDLVTEVDVKIERFIFDALKQRYPEHRFIGEESVDGSNAHLTWDEPTWIVDPIDGTMNFAHFSPWCSVSIGLAIKQKLVLGVIDCPHLGRTYSAIKNGGAHCNGKPIRVSSINELEKALIQSDLPFGSSHSKFQNYTTKLFDSIHWKCQGFRSVGSCCVSLCLVAEGAADAYFMHGLKIWDMAAAYVIVNEAGGFICHINGEDFDPNKRNLIAACNSKLATEIVDRFRDAKQ